jgi:hypothetical protein
LDAESVLSALGLLDVDGLDLWNLEGTQASERTELNDDIVSLAVRRPPQVFDFAVGEPNLMLVSSSRFNVHYDYSTFRYY